MSFPGSSMASMRCCRTNATSGAAYRVRRALQEEPGIAAHDHTQPALPDEAAEQLTDTQQHRAAAEQRRRLRHEPAAGEPVTRLASENPVRRLEDETIY